MASLEAALKTYKVNVGAAPRLESERYIGTGEFKMCPRWGGNDLVGRAITPDSYYTKAPGCHSALDRVLIENQITRPRYYTYIALSPEGMNGDIYGTRAADRLAINQQAKEQFDYVVPFQQPIGFGSPVTSAIFPTVPDERLLQAEAAYSGGMQQ